MNNPYDIHRLLVLAGVKVVSCWQVLNAGDSVSDYLSAGSFSAGVFSAGNSSFGVFASGIFAMGIFSIGMFSFGIFSIGHIQHGAFRGRYLHPWEMHRTNTSKLWRGRDKNKSLLHPRSRARCASGLGVEDHSKQGRPSSIVCQGFNPRRSTSAHFEPLPAQVQQRKRFESF